MKKDKCKEEGEVGVTFVKKKIGSGSEAVYPEDHPSSPSAFSTSSKPPSFIARVSSVVSETEKEHLFDHEEVMSNILPVVELPPPPDGGWGWVVCFAGFMCNLILDGLCYTFGVMLDPLVDAFKADKSVIALVGSLMCGVYLMSGPIVGGLVNKFGCRPVCIMGSIVACIGFVLSIFSPNVPVLILTYGIIVGFGLGLIYLPSVVAVGYYFEKKRALATGIAVCGSGVGTFLFAPLATLLLDTFGWKGANLIYAGLCLNCAVFGALMRPLVLTATKIEPEKNPFEDDDEGINLEIGDSHHESKYTLHLPDGTKQDIDQSMLHADASSNSPFHLNHEISSKGPSIPNVTPLPTIAELSITGASTQKDERVPVMDIFPKEEDEEDDEVTPLKDDERQHQHVARKRTISETHTAVTGGSKFQVTQVQKEPCKSSKLNVPSMPIPRNKTAPNFVLGASSGQNQLTMNRISSNPALGRLVRLSSQHGSDIGSHEHFFCGFDLHEDSDANTKLTLEPGRRGSRKDNRPIVRPMYRKDVFYSGSIANLVINDQPFRGGEDGYADEPKLIERGATDINHTSIIRRGSTHKSFVSQFSHDPAISNAQLDEYRNSVISLPKFFLSRNSSAAAFSIPRGSIIASHLSIPISLRKASIAEGVEIESEGIKPIMTVFKEMINITLLANPYFLLIALSNAFGMLGFYVPFVYLPGIAQTKGVEIAQANFLISIIGISNTVGRVAAGWFSDFSWVNPLFVTNIAIFLSGVCTMAMPLCPDYYTFVAIALAFGLFVAAYISLTSIVLVELLGLDNLTSAFGILILVRGVFCMVGSPVAGSVFDQTQRYDISFYMSGGFLVIAGLVSCIAHILQIRNRNKQNILEK